MLRVFQQQRVCKQSRLMTEVKCRILAMESVHSRIAGPSDGNLPPCVFLSYDLDPVEVLGGEDSERSDDK